MISVSSRPLAEQRWNWRNLLRHYRTRTTSGATQCSGLLRSSALRGVVFTVPRRGTYAPRAASLRRPPGRNRVPASRRPQLLARRYLLGWGRWQDNETLGFAPT